MRVQNVMRRSPTSCSAATNLAAVIKLLSSAACEALPVLDGDGKVVGNVAVCRPSDEVHAVLKLMASKMIRHVPVVNEEESWKD